MKIDYTLIPQARVSAGRSGQVQNVRAIHEVVPGSVVRGALGAAWWSPTDARFEPASQSDFNELFTQLMDVHAAVPRMTLGEKATNAEFERFSWVRCKYRSHDGCPDGRYDQAFSVVQGTSDWLHTCPACDQPVEPAKQGWRVKPDWSVATVRAALTEDGVAKDDMLFTRRAMVREVQYTGTLQLASEPNEQVLAWLLEPKVIRVGGQRSTMGTCRWKAVVGADTLPEVSGDCVVELRSPAILIDEFGAPRLDLAREINHLLAKDAAGTVRRVWTRPEVVTGWHGIAGLPKPSEWAVAAGSVALIGDATPKTVDLLAAGIGLRRAEGYGQVRVCPPPSRIEVDGPTESPHEVAQAEKAADPLQPPSPLEVLKQLVPDALLDQTLRAVLAEAQRIKQLRDGGFPDHILSQRIAGLVNRPWMRDLSGDAQEAVRTLLSSSSLSDYLSALNAAIGQGGSR